MLVFLIEEIAYFGFLSYIQQTNKYRFPRKYYAAESFTFFFLKKCYSALECPGKSIPGTTGIPIYPNIASTLGAQSKNKKYTYSYQSILDFMKKSMNRVGNNYYTGMPHNYISKLPPLMSRHWISPLPINMLMQHTSNFCITHLNPLNEEHTVLKNKIIVAFHIYSNFDHHVILSHSIFLGLNFGAFYFLSLIKFRVILFFG